MRAAVDVGMEMRAAAYHKNVAGRRTDRREAPRLLVCEFFKTTQHPTRYRIIHRGQSSRTTRRPRLFRRVPVAK